MTVYLAMANELLVANKQNGTWKVNPQLVGLQVTCLAADPFRPERVYCGTYGRGLWCTDNAGDSWYPIGDVRPNGSGIEQSEISAVVVSPVEERPNGYGVVYAGTEMSHMYRSEDGGASWKELSGILELPSASTWSFPPRPTTHHVRWIRPDLHDANHVYVAVEAGALLQVTDKGQTWHDRVPNGPYDTHTLLMHPDVPNRLYSAAGDGFMVAGKGYQESLDGGKSWQYPDEGLHHHYLYGAAVSPADPDTILVSASSTAQAAHHPMLAESFIYRKTKGQAWQMITDVLPEAKGSIIAAFATTPSEPNAFYVLSNKGCYYSADAGLHWERLDIPWDERLLHQHPQAIAVTEG